MGLFGAGSFALAAGLRIDRVLLNPVVEDMVICEEFEVAKCFGLFADCL